MRFGDRIRPLNLLWCLASLLLAGCSAAPRTTAAPGDGAMPELALDEPELNAPSRTGAPATTVDDWAAQADRDVAFLLEQRRHALDSEGADASPAEIGPPASANPVDDLEPPPPQVVWHDAPGVRPATDAQRAAEAETIVQSPLFRDPVEPVAIEDHPSSEATVAAVAEALESDDLQATLVNLRRLVFQRSIDSDQPVREVLAIVMCALLDPEAKLEPEAFRGLTDDEKEMIEHFQEFCSRLGRELDGSEAAREVIINALLELQQELIEEPELKLPAASLCWRVGGFGDYDAFERSAFLAHADQPVILYLEIDGFTSELNARNEWLTEVSQQLEIISDSDGIPVWSDPWQKAVDRTNNRRRDFFTTQRIVLPKELSVGRYHLKIRVRDEKSGAEAEHSVPFEMVADRKLAASIPAGPDR